MKFKKIKIEAMQKIPFKLLHKDYGRAEFILEFVFNKNGSIRRLLIYPQQQPDKKGIYYEVKGSQYTHGLTNGNYADIHKEPRIWYFGICDHHKRIMARIYAPDGTNCFYIYVGSSMGFNFNKS